MIKQIMKSLKKHIPMTDQEGLNRLRNLAEGFEQQFYTGATSQSSYSRKIAMLLLYVETPNQNPHHPAPGVPPQGNNPAQSSAVPLMSQQKIRQGNTSATSATLQQSPEWVLGQQPHLQLSMHQQPSLQQTQPTQQPNRPLQQQLIGQQSNLHNLGQDADETIGQEFWDELLSIFQPVSDNEAANFQSSSSFSDEADGATNPKKHKSDCSSSWAPMPNFSAPVDDHCSAPVPSFPEIPEGGRQYTTLGEPAAVLRMSGIDG